MNAILKSESLTNFINHINGLDDDISAEQLQYFERSQYHDDIRIVVVLKHLFECIEKVNLGRSKNSIVNILNLIMTLENEQFCNELQGFDERFVKHIVEQDYSVYFKTCGNLSESFILLANEFYKDAIVIN